MAKGYLNVVIHGLWALIEDAGFILAVAPDVNGQHVCRAGNWLAPSQVARGFYRLTGVNTGKAQFSDQFCWIMKNKHLKRDSVCKSLATFLFPTPDAIYPLQQIVIDPTSLDGNPLDYPSAPYVACASQAWVYNCDDVCKTAIEGFCWEPPQGADCKLATVHVYAAEDCYYGPFHTAGAVSFVSGLFEDVDISVKPGLSATTPGKCGDLPHGVCDLEVRTLAQDLTALSALGELVRNLDSGDLRGLFASLKPTDSDTSCSPVCFVKVAA